MAAAKDAPEKEPEKTTSIGEVTVEVVPEVLFKQEPAIGRIVHYVTSSGTIRPAIIAAVGADVVDVVVFNRTDGALYVEDVFEDADDETIGTYHWPVIG